MAHEEEKLPWDLIEEILSRVPPKSLARSRIVCKRWNDHLSNDRRFINNHKMAFRFVLATKSKVYSVNVVNLEIVVRELTLDIPGLDESPHQELEKLVDCNEFLLCRKKQGAAVWNPWLGQSTWIEPGPNQSSKRFMGIGYDDNRSYKIISSCPPRNEDPTTKTLWRIYDFASDAWKDNNITSTLEGKPRGSTLTDTSSVTTQRQNGHCFFIHDKIVSLNGTLYRVAALDKTDQDSLFIIRFDFSKEGFIFFCELPCGKNHVRDALVLGVYKGDRFSLLKQCYETKKIEVFVSKDKISNICDVVWMNLMQVSAPDFPDLVQAEPYYYQPSYFIDDNDKRLVVCSCDETGRAWIYVVWRNKLIRKIQIDSVVDPWPLHCTYTPSLVMVPSVHREEVQLSSSVTTQACEPSGDDKVVRRWVDLFRPVPVELGV